MPERAAIDPSYRTYQAVGLVLGPAAFALMLLTPAPQGLEAAGWATAALAVLMAIWWASEAIPLAATALLPLVLLPLLGVADIRAAAAPFANPLIFLFLGGFLIALAAQRWNLHRRVALHILAGVGRCQIHLIAGAMLATALLSMWISNTATTLMMLPIGVSLISLSRTGGDRPLVEDTHFATCMMLGIAYAATIGGLATPIGSPPNALAISYLSQTHSVELTFLGWMQLALPVTLVMLPIAWFVLTRVAFPISKDARIDDHGVKQMLAELPPMSTAEKRVAAVFAAVAGGWVLHPFLDGGSGAITDTGIALAGAILLFAIPADWRTRTFLLDWPTARNVPWEVLILFGGGLSLAYAIDQTGLGGWLGRGFEFLALGPPIVLIAGITLLVILLTELTSNTATAAAFLPIVGAFAISADMDPLVLAAPVALAASSAFMLPVATPPNAIVFGSGHVTIPQMIRAGAGLNLAGVIVITAAILLLAPR